MMVHLKGSQMPGFEPPLSPNAKQKNAPPPFSDENEAFQFIFMFFFLFSKAFPLLWRNLIKNFSTSLVLISPIAFLPNLN